MATGFGASTFTAAAGFGTSLFIVATGFDSVFVLTTFFVSGFLGLFASAYSKALLLKKVIIK